MGGGSAPIFYRCFEVFAVNLWNELSSILVSLYSLFLFCWPIDLTDLPICKAKRRFMLLISAPAGCLMYYTDLSGTVRSFNYGPTVSGALVINANNETRPGTRELANLNYGVCIAMQPGYCSIQWSQSAGEDTSFTVTGDTISTSVITGLPSGSVIGENCTTDFVVIPNPSYVNGTAVPGDRFCGNQFPTITCKQF